MKDVSQFAVRPNKCSTCPFRIKNGKYRDPELASRLEVQILSGVNHICHHEALKGRESTHICRGAKDYSEEILYRLELIKSTGSQ